MDVNEYRSVLHEDIALAASANMSNEEEEFLSYVTDILIAGRNSMILQNATMRELREEKRICA